MPHVLQSASRRHRAEGTIEEQWLEVAASVVFNIQEDVFSPSVSL
jgi:hypothetical protein